MEKIAIEAVAPGKTKLGWIGTGVMGSSMCSHLMDAGFDMTIFSRTKSKAEELINRGAQWVDSPADVAKASDVIFTIVGFPHDVHQVILGPSGVLSGCKPGNVIVDMTTSEPSLASEINRIASEHNVYSLDAPVSGGDKGAREGILSIMIGGDPDVVEALAPCWQAMGKTIVHQGPAGCGQHTKMVNQTLIASGMVAVCEALVYGHKAGLNLETVMLSVSSGAAGSWSLNNLGPRVLANDFDPGFFVEHFVKDMGIALDESRRMGLCLPGLALAEQLYQSVMAKGGGKLGTQALTLAIAELAGFDWQTRQEQ